MYDNGEDGGGYRQGPKYWCNDLSSGIVMVYTCTLYSILEQKLRDGPYDLSVLPGEDIWVYAGHPEIEDDRESMTGATVDEDDQGLSIAAEEDDNSHAFLVFYWNDGYSCHGEFRQYGIIGGKKFPVPRAIFQELNVSASGQNVLWRRWSTWPTAVAPMMTHPVKMGLMRTRGQLDRAAKWVRRGKRSLIFPRNSQSPRLGKLEIHLCPKIFRNRNSTEEEAPNALKRWSNFKTRKPKK
ncbi:uncharacterized protein BT62DRAFT_917038 [Guyanagaster necrorhizus]|uniref:Uncharacterized protein n=1 Tax=Guyanagaster necrorhizus TaxID=856835 RepID=A0A9P7W213_9AGAR|nr:uncharacterized protein BT62DRAFT_917038 [Guyanagaster necrorhizus MCA 3950]KAG7450717.1 hypothetical protein BT62DRAFT_917038 [Guyanagaster necrorhizus MCA 3950]